MAKKEVERLAPPIETVSLLQLAEDIGELVDLVSSQIPKGESPSFLKAITDRIKDVKSEYPFPWFSFTLHNYGDDSVFLGVNKKPITDPVYSDEVKKDETRDVDMGAAKIDKIYLVCKQGETATVRIRGVY